MDGVNYGINALPGIPRSFLVWALGRAELRSNQSIRRLAAISVNSGIPVHLFDSIQSIPFGSVDFERIGLPLNMGNDDIRSNDVLRRALDNISDATTESSSEADIRSFIWDRILDELLIEATRGNRTFTAHSEWKSRLTFDQSTERRIDWTAIAGTSPESGNIPFFLVEIGKQRSPVGYQHKDFTKLLTMMSQSCLKMCSLMRTKGKNPKLVRIYGLWIGSTQFQFCVAHPVFKKNLVQGRIEISVHLSFSTHWRFDLLQVPGHPNCDEPCCNSEILAPSIIEVPNTSPIILEIIQRPPVGIEIVELSTETADNAPYPISSVVPESRYDFDYVALSKLQVFIKCVLGTGDALDGDSTDPFESNFPFYTSTISIFPAFTDSSTTAFKKIRRNSISSLNFTAGARLFFISMPADSLEVQLYRTTGLHKTFMSHVYDFKVDPEEPGMIELSFERMTHLSENGKFSSVVRRNSTEELVLEGATFAVHILFGLLILHEQLKCVHSDISPSNIMFSEIHGIWKLNDFGNSMTIEESSRTFRKSGTTDFIAPEVIEGGFLIPKSDVFSLGKVLYKYFYFSLMMSQEIDDLEEDTVESIEEFVDIISKMTSPNISIRISVREALKLFYNFTIKNLLIDFKVYAMAIVLVIPLAH